MMLLSSGRLAAATLTFSAGEEFIYTLIFVVYSGVSNDTPFFSLWILDNFIGSTLVTRRQPRLNLLALAGPISFMTS
jgi:NADH:ubiquinone oxidoreductase subunit 6 (subunit J)